MGIYISRFVAQRHFIKLYDVPRIRGYKVTYYPGILVTYPWVCSCHKWVRKASIHIIGCFHACWIIERRPLWSLDVDESWGEKKGGGEVISGEGKGRGLMIPVQERGSSEARPLMWSSVRDDICISQEMWGRQGRVLILLVLLPQV